MLFEDNIVVEVDLLHEIDVEVEFEAPTVLDAICGPATVNNHRNEFIKDIASGESDTVPSVKIYQGSETPSNLVTEKAPGESHVIDDPDPCLPGTILDHRGEIIGSVASGGSYPVRSVIIYNGPIGNQDKIAEKAPGEFYESPLIPTAQGIQYKDISELLRSQTTSYDDYDQGWLFANGWLQHNVLPNPEQVASGSKTLNNPIYIEGTNIFGNQFRFTDSTGVWPIPSPSYGVVYYDHLYGVMIFHPSDGTDLYGDILADPSLNTKGGVTGWFLPPYGYLETCRRMDDMQAFRQFLPIRFNIAAFMTCTTVANDTSRYWAISNYTADLNPIKALKASKAYRYFFIRKFSNDPVI